MNNTVFLAGVLKQCDLDNETYKCKIAIPRKSEVIDVVPVEINKNLYENHEIKEDDLIMISGVMRSRNTSEDKSSSHLEIFAHANDVKKVTDEEIADVLNTNFVKLEGFICRKNNIRRKENRRPILSILLAHNRKVTGDRNDSDYIPCVFWGENAEWINECSVGDKLILDGRFQSRSYNKYDDNDVATIHEVYELSVKNIIDLKHRRRKADSDGNGETSTGSAGA